MPSSTSSIWRWTRGCALPSGRRTRALIGSPGATLGLAAVTLVALCALSPGLLAPAAPNEQRRLARFTPPIARTAHGALAVRERVYVDAARSLGMSLPRIVVRHILPNVSASLIVVATFGVAGAILTEAGLSFLGLGVPLAIPSWGGMLAEGRQFVDTRYWLALSPGVALFATVMAINLIGDALRDALDPYLQTRGTVDRF